MSLKRVNLEYSDIPAYLPPIDYFLEKISTYDKFNFLRVNHGFIDSLHYAYSDYELLKTQLVDGNYDLIGKTAHSSYNDVKWGFSHFHGVTENVWKFSSLLLKILVENKKLSDTLDLSISLGVGLNEHWGVWEDGNPIQIARTKFAKILTDITNQTFIYSGVFKHYTIKGEIFKMFELLNQMNYEVIFLGPSFFKRYEEVFSITNFQFIEIPPKGAIAHTESYIQQIKNIQSKSFRPTILFHMCGHIMSAKIVYELLDTNIFTVDVGRSFDILIKDEFVNGDQAQKCWTFLDEVQLNKYVDNLINNSYV